MRTCWIKDMCILQAADGKYWDLLKGEEFYQGHHAGCARMLKYINDKIEYLMNHPDNPPFCASNECYGGVPQACDCGCEEGSTRCDGVNHR